MTVCVYLKEGDVAPCNSSVIYSYTYPSIFKKFCDSRHLIRVQTRAGEPDVFGSLEQEPKKSQEPEPLKNFPAPQSCWKIKGIRKLYVCYSSLGKIVSFYG